MEDNHSCDTSLGYLKACQSVIDDGVIRQKDMNLATKLARFGLLSRYSLRDDKLPLLQNQKFSELLPEFLACIKEIPTLPDIVQKLIKNPDDRRILLCPWNVKEAYESKVHPRDCLAQFYVADHQLSCLLVERSADLLNEAPHSILKYSLLTHILANICDLRPVELIHAVGEYYIPGDQLDQVSGQRSHSFPTLKVTRRLNSIDDIQVNDFQLSSGNSSQQISDINSNDPGVLQSSNILACKLETYPTNAFSGNGNEAIPVNNQERQYLNVCKYILEKGIAKNDRTKVGTLSVFGVLTRYSLRNDTFPLLTTKKVFYKAVVEELLWFIRGCTDSKILDSKGVKIWNQNGSRQFLDSLGFHDREEGDLGPVYGFQWRHFGAEYKDQKTDYTGMGIDQLANLIESIRKNPTDGHHIINSWNVSDLNKMALPPCHCFAQFYVVEKKLSCLMYQRSGDMGLGVPFNIASYSLLTYILANIVDLEPDEFIHVIGDAHIYSNHVAALKEQLKREPREFPKLKIRRKLTSIDDVNSDDFLLEGYHPYPKIAMEMAV